MFPEASTGPPGAYQIIGGHRLEQTQFFGLGTDSGRSEPRTSDRIADSDTRVHQTLESPSLE